MNDRRMTERIMHAKFLLIVVSGGVDYDKYPVAKTVEGLLIRDMDDTVSGLEPRRAEKLMMRSSSAVKLVSSGYVLGERASPAKLGLMIFYLLRNLVDQGYVGFEDSSPMALALETILPALEDHTDEPGLDKSAQKQARHLFHALQREGYYQGAKWSE